MRPPGFVDSNGAHVTVGDVCYYAFGGTCEVRDVTQDGDAEIIWRSGPPGVPGTHDTVKWNNLTKKESKPMTEDHKPLPVSGYTPQSDAKVALVNSFKQDEERLLRKIDALDMPLPALEVDRRLLAMGRSHLQIAFMLLNRAVFQPQRISLPEDIEEALERSDFP